MLIYENFDLFWQEFTSQQVNRFGFHEWIPVDITHTSDAAYYEQRQNGHDELGFQPLVVTEANPFTLKTRQNLVKNINDATTDSFSAYCRNRFYDQFSKRHGSFMPDTFDAYTEYDTWDSFYNSWLERSGKPVFHLNVPLLIDHIPQIEYWTRKQTGKKILPYQRLLITTFFVSENKFFRFFIKNIDDASAQKIAHMTQSRIGIHLDTLYSKDTRSYA